QLRDRVQGSHQQLRDFTKVCNAGKEVDQYRTNVPPGCDPLEDVDEPRGVAAQLAGADITEVEGGMAALRQLVDHLHAQSRAGRDQADLSVRIDHYKVEAVIELERQLWIVIGTMADEIAQARLSNQRVVVNHELEVARGPRSV